METNIQIVITSNKINSKYKLEKKKI